MNSLVYRSKVFHIWRLFFKVHVALSCWAIVKEDGSVFTMWFHVGPCLTKEGDYVFDLVVGPVCVVFAWLPKSG